MLDDFQSIPDAGSLPLYHMVLRLARLSASAAAAADSAQQKMQRQTCARDELLKGGRECATSTCHDLRWQPRVDCKARFEFAALRLREVLAGGARRTRVTRAVGVPPLPPSPAPLGRARPSANKCAPPTQEQGARAPPTQAPVRAPSESVRAWSKSGRGPSESSRP